MPKASPFLLPGCAPSGLLRLPAQVCWFNSGAGLLLPLSEILFFIQVDVSLQKLPFIIQCIEHQLQELGLLNFFR